MTEQNGEPSTESAPKKRAAKRAPEYIRPQNWPAEAWAKLTSLTAEDLLKNGHRSTPLDDGGFYVLFKVSGEDAKGVIPVKQDQARADPEDIEEMASHELLWQLVVEVAELRRLLCLHMGLDPDTREKPTEQHEW